MSVRVTSGPPDERCTTSAASLDPNSTYVICTWGGVPIYASHFSDEPHCYHGGPPVDGCEPCQRRRDVSAMFKRGT